MMRLKARDLTDSGAMYLHWLLPNQENQEPGDRKGSRAFLWFVPGLCRIQPINKEKSMKVLMEENY